MTGDDMQAARVRLGELWSLGRPMYKNTHIVQKIAIAHTDITCILAISKRGNAPPQPEDKPMNQIVAYFYPSRRAGEAAAYELHRLTDGQRQFISMVYVSNKRAARQQAKLDGATPWNF